MLVHEGLEEILGPHLTPRDELGPAFVHGVDQGDEPPGLVALLGGEAWHPPEEERLDVAREGEEVGRAEGFI